MFVCREQVPLNLV